MNTPLLSKSILAEPKPRPFPTRGVRGGWQDPWDADPLAGVVSTIRQRNALRRHLTEEDVQLELLAQARTDGRWEAHVTSSDAAPTRWPSVNGPTAGLALDALEAELRQLLRDAAATSE
jgi:hypothetical protein